MADPTPISMQAIATAIIAVAVLAALAWGLRRSASLRRRNLPISVETAVPLGERRSLVIVSVEGRRLLLGLTPTQVSLVTELQNPFRETLDDSLKTGGAS
ncbi:MAG: flagellar biosynthetic protein FliO [Vicinamibacterales bacterium]